MIDYDRVPNDLYEELVNLLGKDKADKYIKSIGYSYRAINNKILSIYLSRFIRKNLYYIMLTLLTALLIYLISS
jgi:hypothetical protein